MQEILEWLESKRSYDAGVKLYLQYGKDSLLHKLFQEDYSDFKLSKLCQALEQLAGSTVHTDKSQKVLLEKSGAITTPAEAKIITPPDIQELKNQVVELFEEKQEINWQLSDLEHVHSDLQQQVNDINEDVKKLKIAQKSAPRGWPAEMDEIVRTLHDQWLPLFVEKKNLQARIYEVAMQGQKDPAKKKEAGAMAHRILDLRDACRGVYEKRDHYLVHGNIPEEPRLLDIPADPKKWPLTLQNYQRYLRDYKNKLTKLPITEANKSKLADIQKQMVKYQWGIDQIKKLMGI